MHLKSDNIEIMISGEKNSLIYLKTIDYLQLIRGSPFVFDYVHLLYYKCHKINFNHGG